MIKIYQRFPFKGWGLVPLWVVLFSFQSDAGVLDRCMVEFEREDVRIRRIFPSVDINVKRFSSFESEEPYHVLFKLPDSYFAVEGKIVVQIGKLPREGRIDILQAGNQLLRIQYLENGRVEFEPVDIIDGEVVSLGRVFSSGRSWIHYSDQIQVVNMKINGKMEKVPRSMSARLELDLVTLEILSGKSWRNFQSKAYPKKLPASYLSKQKEDVVSFGFLGGLSIRVLSNAQMAKAHKWILRIPKSKSISALTIIDSKTKEAIHLVPKNKKSTKGALSWRESEEGPVVFELFDGQGKRIIGKEIIFNGEVRYHVAREEAHDTIRGITEYEEFRYFVIQGDLASLVSQATRILSLQPRIIEGKPSSSGANFPLNPDSHRGTSKGISGSFIPSRVAMEERTDI